MIRRAFLLAAVSVLSACASIGPERGDATLPAAARAAPRHYIVVTVRNPLLPLPVHAASTQRGYDGAAPYLAGGTARRASRTLASDYRLEEVSSWPIAALKVHCVVYGLPPGADPASLIDRLGHDGRVDSVQPLLSFATASARYNDPYAGLQANLERMSVAEAHELSTGAGVRIAVIDTGADTRHPDFRPHAAIERNFVDTDEPLFHSDAHGTAVAGLIGAVPNNHIGIAGVAPDAQLLVLKACWRVAQDAVRAECNTFTLAKALGAALDAHVDVINLSLAGPPDPLLTRLVRHAIDRGIIVVGAVPPAGAGAAFPSDISGVISVDASESARSTGTTLRAPGRDVLSLAPDGHYDFYSGSSLATAEVSGLVALLRAGHPQLSAHDVTALLLASSQSTGDRTATDVPNACAALRALRGHGNCAAPR